MTEVVVIMGVFLAQIFSLQAILGNPTGTSSTPRSKGKRVQPFAQLRLCSWQIESVEAEGRSLGWVTCGLVDMGDLDEHSFDE